MSWISGLADKAENILNKIDKNAATALQVPAAEGTSNVIKKTLSGSTQSLKQALSPTKSITAQRSLGPGTVRASSVKSESGITPPMTISIESNKDKLEQSVYSEESTSRRSSISSRPEAISIDIDSNDSQKTYKIKAQRTFDTKEKLAPLQLKKVMSTGSLEQQELAAFKIALSEITMERDELLLRLSMLNNDVENEGLKQRAQELEILLQRLTEERDLCQENFQKAETASSAYVRSISDLESNLAKMQQECMDTADKLQMQIRETEHQRQDLQQYRKKAQFALQMKDNLIAELKASDGNASATLRSDADNHLIQMELNTIKEQLQQALEDNRSLLFQLEEGRRDLSAIGEKHKQDLTTLRLNEEGLRKELRGERERSLSTESEQRMLSQEVDTLRQQLSNHMAASATRLQQKDQQLQQLRASMGSKAPDVSLDYSTRIKTLTQALVEKQNAVENVTAERNAMRIQLEKMHDQLTQNVYNNNKSAKSSPRNALLSNTTDDVKAQFPILMRENPFDTRVARRVKRAYSSLDSAGIRLGAFLRRYPLMRISVLMYVGLLHIWVIFVLLSLLSSTPN